ncbi:NAD(P)-dependent oxidoreductase [soil metagenome]
MKVLITGAAGNLGQKICAHLAPDERYALTLLDRRTTPAEAILAADLAVYDESWVSRFAGQDVVVHLAAEANPFADWNSLQNNNVDAMINVFRASVANRVKRIVFASTSRGFLGYAKDEMPVRHDSIPKPTDYYAATKLFGERLGKSYAEQYKLSVICLRIGTMWPGDNSPAGKRPYSQRRWLSTRDFCQAVERAIETAGVEFAALFVTSNNEGKPFDLSETERVLGYVPQDGAKAVVFSLPKRVICAVRRRLRRLSRRRSPTAKTGGRHDGT